MNSCVRLTTLRIKHCMQDKQLNEGVFQMARAGSEDYDVDS